MKAVEGSGENLQGIGSTGNICDFLTDLERSRDPLWVQLVDEGGKVGCIIVFE